MLKPSKHSGMVNPNHALSTVSQNSSSGKNKNTSPQTCTFCTAPGFALALRATIVHFPSFVTHEFQLAKGVCSKKLHSKEQNHPHHKQMEQSLPQDSQIYNISFSRLCRNCTEQVLGVKPSTRFWTRCAMNENNCSVDCLVHRIKYHGLLIFLPLLFTNVTSNFIQHLLVALSDHLSQFGLCTLRYIYI